MTDSVLIPGGDFWMGSEEFYPDEGPTHLRSVGPFRIDRHAVTNVRFEQFVRDTGYVTVAERPLDPADFPGADPADLVSGSMVFTPTAGPVDLGDWRQWWRWLPGASWRHPFGPDSGIRERPHHPVVHVAYEDSVAFADWSGARLPTEAEHEFAAGAGLGRRRFAWGDEPYPDGKSLANTWLGRFPHENRGVGDAAPVGSYPANGFGLHDMIGNVWEWTSDVYAPRHILPGAQPVERGERAALPTVGGAGSEPVRRVLKGGSYLCSPDYCLRFRPAARSPQTEDSATTHIGFRCARDA